MTIECVLDSACALGEGPYYDRAGDRLIFVDIIDRKAYLLTPGSGALRMLDFPESVSAVVPHAGGGYIATLASRVARVSEDGAISDFAVGDTNPAVRSNEARTDSRGRLWLGTMQNNIGPNREDLPITTSIGTLHRIDPDGRATKFLDRIGVSNTLVWSPDDRIMYFADTRTKHINAYDFDAETGTMANGRPIVTDGPGGPDGSTMDEEGCIWNARWGGSCLIRYRPDGTQDRRIELPVKQPTSCVFGGADLSTLYITSARVGIQQPGELDGAVLAIRPGVKGLACVPFGVGDGAG
jgi:sugar lactone lactonase YvrE